MPSRATLVRLLVLLALLTLSALTVSAQPGNDNAADALPLLMNGKVTAKNVSTATVETGEFDDCGAPSDASVWYYYQTPYYINAYPTTISVDVERTGSGVPFVALYTSPTLVTDFSQLTFLDCYSDNVDVLYTAFPPLQAETYYYIAIGFKVAARRAAADTLKLTTYVDYLSQFYLEDPSIETAPNDPASPWKLVNTLNGDGHDCTESTQLSCSVKFVGKANEATKLVQTVNVPLDVFKPLKRDFIDFYYRVMSDAPASMNIKGVLKLIYSDGTPTNKIVVKPDTSTMTPFVWTTWIWDRARLQSNALIKYKVIFVNRSPKNVNAYIDDLYVEYYNEQVRPGDARGEALPLPHPGR